MQTLIDNKKLKILFYLFIFIFLSTINFTKLEKVNNLYFFPIHEIELSGTDKIKEKDILEDLSFLYGKNIFTFDKNYIKNILIKNDLIKEFKITKHYLDKIKIDIKEVEFIALVIKEKKKYFLTNNQKLISFNEDFNKIYLHQIYGKNGEIFFKDFYEKLLKNQFNINLIKGFYFFQINRWDLILNNNLLVKFPINELEESIILANELIKKSKFKNVKIIDLRIKGRVVVQ